MELEHLFQQPNVVMALQMIFSGVMLAPAAAGRLDLYRRFVNAAASAVVNVGPMALLTYLLYEVSRLA
jgi:hypothetical protein